MAGKTENTSYTAPSLKILAESKELCEVKVDELGDEHWQAIREKLLAADGEILLNVVNFSAWPKESRVYLIALAKEFNCSVGLNGQVFGDPFEAALTAVVGNACMSSHKSSLECVIQVAALCHPEAAEAAAARINEKLSHLGIPKINIKRLVSQIRPTDDGGGDEDLAARPGDLAVAFLEHLREKHQLDDDTLPVHFFQGDFYAWDGKRWQRLEDKRFFAQVMRFLQHQSTTSKLSERFARDVIGDLMGRTLLNCWNESMPFYIVDSIEPQLDKRNLVVFSNGMFDLGKFIKCPTENAAILSYDSRWFNEIVLPYSFDPAATCPLWLKTVKEILPQKSKTDKRQDVLQEFCGYTLLHDCRFQKYLVMIGDGGNGKSTITETWQAMLGEENVSAVGLESLGDDYRQWGLKGKLANFSGELSYLGKVNEGNLKRIVSGEPVDANRKHRDPTKLRLQAKLIINTNDMPRINDATRASWDRMIAVPFLERFRDTKKDDKDRPAKLQAELPGIFNWALKGLVRLLANGKFTECKLCHEFNQEHRTESDSVLAFLKECSTSKKNEVVFSKQLYDLYRHYCVESGRKNPFGDAEFGKRMRRAGYEKIRAPTQPNGIRPPAYRGITLSADGKHYWNAIKYKYGGFDPEDDPPQIGYSL